MPVFYAGMDCFISTSHIEAWGFSTIEAMAMGLPIIATAYGGSTQFGPKENIVENNTPSTVQEGSFDGGWGVRVIGFEEDDIGKGIWAIPDINHLKQLMRYVYEHKDEGEKKGRAGRRRIVEKFSQEAVAALYLQRLREIGKALI